MVAVAIADHPYSTCNMKEALGVYRNIIPIQTSLSFSLTKNSVADSEIDNYIFKRMSTTFQLFNLHHDQVHAFTQ